MATDSSSPRIYKYSTVVLCSAWFIYSMLLPTVDLSVSSMTMDLMESETNQKAYLMEPNLMEPSNYPHDMNDDLFASEYGNVDPLFVHEVGEGEDFCMEEEESPFLSIDYDQLEKSEKELLEALEKLHAQYFSEQMNTWWQQEEFALHTEYDMLSEEQKMWYMESELSLDEFCLPEELEIPDDLPFCEDEELPLYPFEKQLLQFEQEYEQWLETLNCPNM